MDYVKTDNNLSVHIAATSNVEVPDAFFNRLANLLITEVRCGMIETEGLIEYTTPDVYVMALWRIERQQ